MTDAGSAPVWLLTMSTPTRSAHTVSCSTAAARNVSAAATITVLPSFIYFWASLAMVVVFPTPLTPTTMIITGMVISFFSTVTMSAMMDFSKSLASSVVVVPLCLMRSLSSSTIFTEVSMPISDRIRLSSNSSK